MKWKKLISGILTTAIIITAGSGCSSQTKQTNADKDVAMGRYVEEDIKMPDPVVDGNEIVFQMYQNPQKQIEILSAVLEPKEGERIVQYTLKEDNSWERKVPKALNQESLPNAMAYAADGTMYIISSTYKDEKEKIQILKSTDGTSIEKVPFKEFEGEVSYENAPISITALEDNNILLSFWDGCTIYNNGKAKYKFDSASNSFALSDGKILMLNKKGDGVFIGDMNSGKILTSIPLQANNSSLLFSADQNGNWYMASRTGIHRLAKEGTTWETILEGSLASMSLPAYGIETFLTGEKEDFYIMYQYGDGKRDIKHYIYKEDVPTTPSETLSIISLEENPTVRQSIIEYQRQHLDVKVDYRVAMSEGDGTTKTDQMKVINTEILAGKGADIMILDGMPIDSYIEKGVLEDLSDVVKPLIDNGEIQSNFIEGFQVDNKIYTTPLRFALPLAFGKKEAVQATDSMQNLADYAKNKASKSILTNYAYSYSKLITTMFQIYGNDLINKKNEWDKEALTKFLVNLKEISDQTHAMETAAQEEDTLYYLQSSYLYNNEGELGFGNINQSFSLYLPMEIMKRTEGQFKTMKDEFIPVGLVGLNKSSKKKNLSTDFIKVLYSENVQKNELGDGLPINSKALENWGIEKNDFLIGFGDFDATQPSKEDMLKIISLSKSLKNPIIVDQVLIEMVIDEVIPYLKGETEITTTTDKLIENTKAYLTE